MPARIGALQCCSRRVRHSVPAILHPIPFLLTSDRKAASWRAPVLQTLDRNARAANARPPPAWNSRPAPNAGALARAAARPWRVAPHRADHPRHLPGEARVALPGTPPLGGGRVADVRLGGEREQPPRQVLPADARRAPAARDRGGGVAA